MHVGLDSDELSRRYYREQAKAVRLSHDHRICSKQKHVARLGPHMCRLCGMRPA